MGKKNNFNLSFCNQVFKAYREGLTDSAICIKFGISEYNLYSIFRKYPLKKDKLRVKRKMNQERIKLESKKIIHGKKITLDISRSKNRTHGERVEDLESKIKSKDKKIRELESLLKLAREHLGKF